MKKIIFSGHLGFGGHFEPFLIISRFVAISHSIRHEKIYKVPNFHKVGTKTTFGQYIITFLGNKTRLRTGFLRSLASQNSILIQAEKYMFGLKTVIMKIFIFPRNWIVYLLYKLLFHLNIVSMMHTTLNAFHTWERQRTGIAISYKYHVYGNNYC